LAIDEGLENKVINMKLTQFTHRRKDDLFKRFRQEQEVMFSTQKKHYERQNGGPQQAGVNPVKIGK
jgi:hypothetical protein